MYKKSIVAAGLLLVFSANSLFAETGTSGTNELNNTLDRFEQARQATIDLKSNSNDMILNTRDQYGKERKTLLIINKSSYIKKSHKGKKIKRKNRKADSTEREKTFKEKYDASKKKDNRKPNEPTGGEKTTSTETKPTRKPRDRSMSKSNKRLYKAIIYARPLTELTPEQRIRFMKCTKNLRKPGAGRSS